MENIIRKPDDMRIICEEQTSDAKTEITVSESSILVQV